MAIILTISLKEIMSKLFNIFQTMGINECHRQNFKMTPHPWVETLYSTYNLTSLLNPLEKYLRDRDQKRHRDLKLSPVDLEEASYPIVERNAGQDLWATSSS